MTKISRLHRIALLLMAIAATLAVLTSCSSTRHVPAGQYLLDKVRINVVDDSAGDFRAEQMQNYLRQLPNHKILWSTKLQLGVYNLSGKDSTRWWNRWIRRLGEAPVIYDSTLTRMGSVQLRNAMVNKGYLGATVVTDTVINPTSRKAAVNYTLYPGKPHIIESIDFEFLDDSIRSLVLRDSAFFAIREGDKLDHALLDSQREIVTEILRNHGYYGFTKEFVSFNADTTANCTSVDLTMIVSEPGTPQAGAPVRLETHRPYYVRNVRVVTNYDPVVNDRITQISAKDTVEYKGLQIFYGRRHYLRPQTLYENCYLKPGEIYRQADVNRTYESLSRLGILKFVSVQMIPVAKIGSDEMIDAYILLTPDKNQSMSLELEGTNSEGDLGVAASISYTHRNIGHGSETFTAKARGAYESISGNLDGLLHNRYMEYTLESTLEFPKFKFPLLSDGFKRSIRASTLLSANFNYQERPEYTRLIAAASWGYQWKERYNNNRHRFQLLDINYVYLPESTNDFINQIAPDNPLLRYSYEDHFIMSMGYHFYGSNKQRERPWIRDMQKDVWTVRAAVETAGNLLLGLSSIFDHRSDFRDNPYKVFGIRYSQYVKAEGDFTYVRNFDIRNSLAFRFGCGVAVPYGNSSVMPFEKRFYGGGASGVRGWDVRTLGPGSFRSENNVSSFIYQCGDIRLISSVEYRAKLFWVLELGLFVDVGNIWTIRNYDTQPGGLFRFDSFYKQLAAAYGVGLRLDFNYFLLRFDLGMKAHNPAEGAEPWPLIHPRWGRDRSFHFSIGYPF